MDLSVDLKTDFVPAIEMIRVETQVLDVERFAEHLPSPDVPFEVGERVAEIEGLPKNSLRRVRVRASGPTGVIAQRDITIRHVEDLAITVVMTRDCANVDCPDSQSCLGGRCVDPECLTGDEPSCPEPACVASSDCPPMDACSNAICSSGVCAYVSAGRCPDRTYCSPEDGCLPIPETDAGMADAAMGDVGTDAGGLLLVPTPVSPLNGEATGVAPDGLADPGLRPRFRWSGDAPNFRLMVDASCDADTWRDCDFPSPEVDVMTPDREHRPANPLLVSSTAPVGTRYYWRVQACETGGECSAWSTVRYVDVGRLGHDIDGDGLDDLLVGYRYGMEVRRSNGDAFRTPQDIPNPLPDGTSDFGMTIATGDINADGFSDVVVGAGADRGFGSFLIYLGAPGALGASVQTVESPLGLNGYFGDQVCVADYNADGFADVAVSARVPSEAFLYLGAGDGRVGAMMGPMNGRIRGCGDLDNDGHADLITSSGVYRGADVGLLLDPAFAMYASHTVVGDLDDDGDLDLASFGSDTASNIVLRGPGGDSSAVVGAGNSSFDLERVLGPGDFNGDGRDGIILGWQGSSAGDDGDAWVLPDGLGPPVRLNIPCTGCRINASRLWGVDFNGDGYGDAAVGSENGERVDVFLGGATGLATVSRSFNSAEDAYGQAL